MSDRLRCLNALVQVERTLNKTEVLDLFWEFVESVNNGNESDESVLEFIAYIINLELGERA